jgi:hypothetical protein
MQAGVDDFETGVTEGAGDDLGPPVVAVQPRFADKYP